MEKFKEMKLLTSELLSFFTYLQHAIHFNNQLEDISGFYSFFISYFTD